ncbi:hypothetical protein ANCDUO_01281 [Ancylostoma duodenale]|uniref:Uncharacterized protein n=1 Tax=Ancylostoma duodenale TaxID=51022 RepID=A0A0C2HFN7_9BILA|nr:hypothetical protein ANCDUO_01281 [Ancylostoma duodenale]
MAERWPVDYRVVVCQATSTVDSVAAYQLLCSTTANPTATTAAMNGVSLVKSNVVHTAWTCRKHSVAYFHQNVTIRTANRSGVRCRTSEWNSFVGFSAYTLAARRESPEITEPEGKEGFAGSSEGPAICAGLMAPVQPVNLKKRQKLESL